MIMCVLLCYPVSIRIYYQQGGRFLVVDSLSILSETTLMFIEMYIYTEKNEIPKGIT